MNPIARREQLAKFARKSAIAKGIDVTTERPKSFDDLRKPTLKIEEIVGEPVMFDAINTRTGRFGLMATVDIYRTHDRTAYTLITGASVVIDRLKAAEEARLLPLEGMVIKVAGDFDYFDLISVDVKHDQYKKELGEKPPIKQS